MTNERLGPLRDPNNTSYFEYTTNSRFMLQDSHHAIPQREKVLGFLSISEGFDQLVSKTRFIYFQLRDSYEGIAIVFRMFLLSHSSKKSRKISLLELAPGCESVTLACPITRYISERSSFVPQNCP